jgi:Fic family protein
MTGRYRQRRRRPLARADGTMERFNSMSAQIEADRKEYYRSLERAQHGNLDVARWLEWFLDCLDRANDGAEVGLKGVLTKARLWEQINRRPVNERQRIVINRMLNGFES